MKTYKFPILTFTAVETVLSQDADGGEVAAEKSYEFQGVEFPNGVVMKLNESAADEFYANASSVEAVGLDVVTGFEDSGVVKEMTSDEIRAAVEASAREYGKDSIPEEMADWLKEVTSASMPCGQILKATTPQARKVWQVWRALAPVAAARGEDVEIAEGEIPGTIEITTVAPQWEGVRVVVELSGAAGWASEQSAPDFGPADLMTSTPPAGPGRGNHPILGWHLTWTSSGASSGAAFQKPGYYPADPEEGTADCVVAPLAFVEGYERREDPERQYPDTREAAVRAYARSQGWPCP